VNQQKKKQGFDKKAKQKSESLGAKCELYYHLKCV